MGVVEIIILVSFGLVAPAISTAYNKYLSNKTVACQNHSHGFKENTCADDFISSNNEELAAEDGSAVTELGSVHYQVD